MTKFRTDNTEGYTAEQLTELNHRYEARIAGLPVENREEKSLCDQIAEHVLAEFDVA